MNIQHGPQGFPQPQTPTPAQPMAGGNPGLSRPWHPAPPSSLASGTAGGLALATGIMSALGVVSGAFGLVNLYSDDDFEPYRSGVVADVVLRMGLFAVFAVLLGIGGFLLLRRKQMGKWMVVVGGEIALAVALWWAIIGDRSNDAFLAMIDMGLVAASAAMLVAALTPATDLWIRARPKTQFTPSNTPRPPVPPYN